MQANLSPQLQQLYDQVEQTTDPRAAITLLINGFTNHLRTVRNQPKQIDALCTAFDDAAPWAAACFAHTNYEPTATGGAAL
jgi:hypothetical protein